MNRGPGGWWISLTGRIYTIPPLHTVLMGGLTILSVLLCLSAIQLLRRQSRIAFEEQATSVSIDAAGRVSVLTDREPLSSLFGLDKMTPRSLVLHSTVLDSGSPPRAWLEADGREFQVIPGDTVLGAVVDSVGRGIVVLAYKGELISVRF